MGEEPVNDDMRQVIDCPDVVCVLAAYTQTVHAGIDADVDMDVRFRPIQQPGVGIIDDGLGQPVAGQQGKSSGGV